MDAGLKVAIQLSTKRRTPMLSDYRCSVGCFELDPLGRLLLHDGVLEWQENCQEEVRGQERAAAIRLLQPELFPGWVVEGSRVGLFEGWNLVAVARVLSRISLR